MTRDTDALQTACSGEKAKSTYKKTGEKRRKQEKTGDITEHIKKTGSDILTPERCICIIHHARKKGVIIIDTYYIRS